METGPARLGGISLDSTGRPVSRAEICPCKVISTGSRAGTKTSFNTKIPVETDIFPSKVLFLNLILLIK